MVAFLLNGFIFIMIGLQLPGILRNLSHEPLSRLTTYGFLISATVVLVRIAWVFPATYLPRWLSPKMRARDPIPPWQHSVLIAWAGMRGVVSLAAAFALPHPAWQTANPFRAAATFCFSPSASSSRRSFSRA